VTAKPGRNDLLDHTLKHGLSSAAAWGPETDCLDAETLAAWVDGGLDRHQAALTEAHLSNCGHCQELLAALSRVLPPAAGQNLGTAAAWRWWLVPMTAAAAVGLWMVMPTQDNLASRSEPATELAQAAPPPEPIPAPTPAPTPAPAPLPAAAPAAALPAAEPPRQEPRVTEERARQAELRQPAPEPPASVPAARTAADTRTPPRVPTVAAPPATAVGTQARAESVAAPMASPPPVLPPPAAASPAPVPLGQVVSPDSRFRWRYSAAGLDRTTDGGATWEQVSEAIGRFVTAGTAPSTTVCWLVARGGGVFVTDDGRTFFRARFPEIVNLVGVSATSRAAATVTTDDGRTFVTSDGGVSWRQQ